VALRIGQSGAASQPAVLPMVEDEPIEAPMDMMPEMPEMGMQQGRVSQESARYFGPEYRCNNCVHYLEGAGGGECEIVAGPIDPEGVCSLFDPDADVLGEDIPEDVEMAEAPVEEIEEV